ncbi:hypothetical protein P152DRAFT_211705 [Eremomyces bilateralis CBS 781.70]|uniref:Uncharacterized protein n=1 Tax=Eremomyces bilateralis CBS 781.70 TaxID=1392243 RepID=A0A6G1FSG0_9PEZI|nr:uncharacterized protein P152DRAFT_211705 [Eremomyces bilateralis CBS 781.70]KAF1808703.1 hypothetical protein P152DRAFT_211705 [Eremomyces bilateralis CBS 781.70]
MTDAIRLASSQQWLNMVQKLAISIAGHLNRLGDRIAVLHSACSFEQSDENDGDCDLYALDHPNVPALKKILSSPAQCRRYSNNCPNDPCEHFNSAVKKVSECLAVPPRVPSSQFQAFIFSRTPMKYWSAMRRLAPSAIHVVLPPGSPCDVPHSRPSGWNIVPTCADMASLTDACGPGCTETGSRISDIMSLARAGVTLEKITDVSICARAGDGCQEQRVVGNTSLRVLRPGQVARLFMQIRVPALEHCLHSREHHRKNPADGAFHDLETLLGDIYTDVLNVEVSFRHSLFPNKSRVVIREDARVRRPDNTSFWANSDAAALSYSNSARIGRKQAIESLASLFAESYSPGKALSDIDELLIEMDYDSSPNDSMGRLRDELDYRYRVEHKLPIPELSIHERSLHSVPSYTEVLSIDSQELLRLSPSVKSVPSVGRSGSRCTIVHNISHKSSHEGSTTRLTPDRARVIWRHMRKDSRGKSPVNVKHLRRRSKDNLKSLGGANSMMLRLKRKALLNKRSIGADSLRSMAFDIAEESRFERDYAPWML